VVREWLVDEDGQLWVNSCRNGIAKVIITTDVSTKKVEAKVEYL